MVENKVIISSVSPMGRYQAIGEEIFLWIGE